MKKSGPKEKFVYEQGVANLRLEGMRLSLTQHKLVRNFQSGKISRAELVEQALAYARTR